MDDRLCAHVRASPPPLPHTHTTFWFLFFPSRAPYKGKFAEGTGSVIQMGPLDMRQQTTVFHAHEQWAGWGERCQCIDCYHLRDQRLPQSHPHTDAATTLAAANGAAAAAAAANGASALAIKVAVGCARDGVGAGAGAGAGAGDVGKINANGGILPGGSEQPAPESSSSASPSIKRPKIVRLVNHPRTPTLALI